MRTRNFYLASTVLLVTSLVGGATTALAYNVSAGIDAFPTTDPAFQGAGQTVGDGVTSLDENLSVTDGATTNAGISRVNLADGSIRLRATSLGTDGRGLVVAVGSWRDTVTFDLPDGQSEALVSASLSANGTLDLIEGSTNGVLRASFGGQGDTIFGTLGELFGTTLSLDLLVTDGVPVDVFMFFRIVVGPTDFGGFGPTNIDANALNSALWSFDLPEGVSFTSESGVFLTAVPIPAAVWLFGSALGLLGWMRRKHIPQ